MGILTRQQGERYVITSDRAVDAPRTTRAPNRLSSEAYEVWTGTAWSTTKEEALGFKSLDAADEYVRQHFAKIFS